MLYVALWIVDQEHTDQYGDMHLVGVYSSLEHAAKAVAADTNKARFRTSCYHKIFQVPRVNASTVADFKRSLRYPRGDSPGVAGVVPVDVAPGATVVVTQVDRGNQDAFRAVRGVFTGAVPTFVRESSRVHQWNIRAQDPDGSFARSARVYRAEREEAARAQAERDARDAEAAALEIRKRRGHLAVQFARAGLPGPEFRRVPTALDECRRALRDLDLAAALVEDLTSPTPWHPAAERRVRYGLQCLGRLVENVDAFAPR